MGRIEDEFGGGDQNHRGEGSKGDLCRGMGGWVLGVGIKRQRGDQRGERRTMGALKGDLRRMKWVHWRVDLGGFRVRDARREAKG